MIVPLSLKTNHNLNQTDFQVFEYSPLNRRRADSLVFSITSEKHCSPKDTILLQSKQEGVSKELESLQLKLQCLESKVSNINSENVSVNRNLNNQIQTEPNHKPFNKRMKIENVSEKENFNMTNKIGKIVKKTNSIIKARKPQASELKIKTPQFHLSARTKLATNQSFVQKEREYEKLKREVKIMQRSIEKSQRSKSLCSEKLSTSKSVIKKLKTKQKKQQQTVMKLKKDLKKSQAIREKQKQIILTQQKQIDNLVKQVTALTKLR